VGQVGDRRGGDVATPAILKRREKGSSLNSAFLTPKALRKNYFSKVDGDDAAKWCTSIAILPEPAEVIFAQDLSGGKRGHY
jgi:hypothetical protein